MTPGPLLLPVSLAEVAEAAELRHADAMRSGDFDQAERWVRLRDAAAELAYRPERDR